MLILLDGVEMFDAGVNRACFHAATTRLSEVVPAATPPHSVAAFNLFLLSVQRHAATKV